MASPEISDLAASFRRDLRRLKRAERTITLYMQSIRFFCDWLTAQGRPTTLDQFTRHAVVAWETDLGERVDVETVRTRHRGLRRFGRWLAAEGELDASPTDGMEIPGRLEKPVRVLADDELTALIKTCAVPRGKAGEFKRTAFDGRRDEVIIRVLLDCGLRVSELVGLEIDTSFDLGREMLFVVGKGNRPRGVPYSSSTALALDRYLRIRAIHPHTNHSSRLLLGERGPMTQDGVRWRLEERAKQAGIEDIHPHAFRHTFAHRWLKNGGQERDLMHLAGWRSDAMLQVYARSTAQERAHDAHRRMGLGDRV